MKTLLLASLAAALTGLAPVLPAVGDGFAMVERACAALRISMACQRADDSAPRAFAGRIAEASDAAEVGNKDSRKPPPPPPPKKN